MAKEINICAVVTKLKSSIVSLRNKADAAYAKIDADFDKVEAVLDNLIAQFCTIDVTSKSAKSKKNLDKFVPKKSRMY